MVIERNYVTCRINEYVTGSNLSYSKLQHSQEYVSLFTTMYTTLQCMVECSTMLRLDSRTKARAHTVGGCQKIPTPQCVCLVQPGMSAADEEAIRNCRMIGGPLEGPP